MAPLGEARLVGGVTAGKRSLDWLLFPELPVSWLVGDATASLNGRVNFGEKLTGFFGALG